MTKTLSLDQIAEFWRDQSLKYGTSHEASWSDGFAIEMEIREITKRLSNGDRILDVGCGNGYSTVQFASQRKVSIRGLDYIPEMIREGRRRLGEIGDQLLGKVEFDIGDITALKEPSEFYDKVVVIRVIINLHDWGMQLKGLHECVRVLKPQGILLLSEATLQGWNKINTFRREWELSDIPMPPFNQYLDEEKVIESLSDEVRLIDLVNFSSTYYVGTRLIKPLLIRALGTTIDVGDPNMEWNRWFAQLPAWGDHGIQKLFVFQKNAYR
jgi:ubiquinone/menaquinone biosynthesis C-methylase UbiE